MLQLNLDTRLWDFAITCDLRSGISLMSHWPFRLQRSFRQTYSVGIIRRTARLDSGLEITHIPVRTTTTPFSHDPAVKSISRSSTHIETRPVNRNHAYKYPDLSFPQPRRCFGAPAKLRIYTSSRERSPSQGPSYPGRRSGSSH